VGIERPFIVVVVHVATRRQMRPASDDATPNVVLPKAAKTAA
jgi:hypothetical protein